MSESYEDLLGLTPAAPPASELVPAAAGGEMAIGAYEGASRFNSQLMEWNPVLGSADLDIIPDKPIGDARARDMLRNDAFVQGGMSLHKDNIVGAQFMLNAKPSSAVLFGKQDDEWEEAFQAEVEELFHLAAESPDNLFDASRMNTFTELVRLAVGINVAGGEILATSEWKKDGRPFNTAIQMVDADRLSTPTMPYVFQTNPNIRAGILKDNYGVPQKYYIKNRHPNDIPTPFLANPMDYWLWTEVSARKPWGRLQVIHIFTQMRAAQTRGISAMVSALKAMHITHKFRDVTLQNAVTQALYAAAITSDLDTEAVFQRLGSNATSEDYQAAITNYMKGYYGVIGEFVGNSKSLHVDGVRIPHLPPGTKLDIISPGKGGPLGMEFEQSLLRYIAATLNVSYEQLSRDYTNTNYSSARAAMTETWKAMQAIKKEVADRFATHIYRLWLEEMVSSNQLTTFPASMAPMLYGAGDGTMAPYNLKWEALARCDWIGASRGQIDELKETQAAVLRVQNGLSTYENEISRLGGDWRKQFRQMSRERKMAKDLELPFAMDPPADTTNTTNALSGNKKNAKGVGSASALYLDAPKDTTDDDQ
jgi:lambda family phage portal protein